MILNLANNDYANYSHDNAKALKAVGLECLDFVKHPHIFGYESQSIEMGKDEMITQIKKAEVIQIMHSNLQLFQLAVKFNPGAKIIIYHTGTIYRTNYKRLNNAFKGYKTITDQTEFMELGDHEYIVSPVDYKLSKLYNKGLKKIGHYPSSVQVKGTVKILELLENIKQDFDLLHSVENVLHADQIKRIGESDIYVELFKPKLNGNNYGCFGVTALEACSMGKIVITQNLYENIYEDNYGYCPMTIANNEEQFINNIEGLLRMSRTQFRTLQKDTHEIMKENHSYKSTGLKIAKQIYES